MYNYYKYNILPEERFKNTSNLSIYTIRFKELAFKSFYLMNNRLYYIKSNNTKRLNDGNFQDINQVILKQIPYTYEIIPILDEIHNNYGHISYKTLAKKFKEGVTKSKKPSNLRSKSTKKLLIRNKSHPHHEFILERIFSKMKTDILNEMKKVSEIKLY